jgi:hypothetical protein
LATIDVNTITDAELDELHAAGVRGARLHEMSWGHGHQAGGSQIGKKVQALADRLARLGWVIGIFCDVRGEFFSIITIQPLSSHDSKADFLY